MGRTFTPPARGSVRAMPTRKCVRQILLTAAVAAVCVAVRADVVELINGQRFSGPNVTIKSVEKGRITIRIGGADGTELGFGLERVHLFEVDIAVRLASLAAEKEKPGPQAYLDLGSICIAAKQPDAAAAAFEAALEAMPPLEDERLLSVAAFLEQQRRWLAAAGAYRRYAAKHPGRRDLVERAEALEKKAAAEAHRTPTTPVSPTPNVTNAKPTAKPIPVVRIEGWEDFERWSVEKWGNVGTVAVITQQADGENRVLALNFTSADKEKFVARRMARLDLTGKKELSFDAFLRSDKPARIAVAFNTLPGWQFFESKQRLIRPDNRWNPVTIDLEAKAFKCEATNWRHEAELENRGNVRQLLFLVYNAAPGEMYIDNVFVKGAEETAP